MKQLRYRVRFLTPAFLGNAEQAGQWRVPPFKALLRQWWRVVWAANQHYSDDFRAMRRAEGLLFGNAWLKNEFRKSQVLVRLSHWNLGTLKSWNGLEQPHVSHPEVQKTGHKVGPHAYLGYGPLDVKGGTKLKGKTAVGEGEEAVLSIAAPDAHIQDILAALALINAYGTVGGRSRNGWGSLALEPVDNTPELPTNLSCWMRPWEDALRFDWPNAIGRDASGTLVWQIRKLYDDWKVLMRDLAIIKIGVRTMFSFPNARPPHGTPSDRHWLSYPVTRHGVRNWQNARLPNSLRFKVRTDGDELGKLRAIMFHVPCKPPPTFNPNNIKIQEVWQKVHSFLDELARDRSSRRYSMFSHGGRSVPTQIDQFDTVDLQRIRQ